MNWLDIVLAIPIFWGLYKGLTNGFIMEVARLVALIAGVYLAVRFAQELSEYIYKNNDFTNEFLPIISFAIIFVGVVLLVHFFAKVIEKLVKAVTLGWANKAAGAAFTLPPITGTAAELAKESPILGELHLQLTAAFEPVAKMSTTCRAYGCRLTVDIFVVFCVKVVKIEKKKSGNQAVEWS